MRRVNKLIKYLWIGIASLITCCLFIISIILIFKFAPIFWAMGILSFLGVLILGLIILGAIISTIGLMFHIILN